MTAPRSVVGERFDAVDVLGLRAPGTPDPSPEALAALLLSGAPIDGEPFLSVRVIEAFLFRGSDGLAPPRRTTRSGFS